MACGCGTTLCRNSAGGLQFLASLCVSPGAHRHFIGGSDYTAASLTTKIISRLRFIFSLYKTLHFSQVPGIKSKLAPNVVLAQASPPVRAGWCRRSVHRGTSESVTVECIAPQLQLNEMPGRREISAALRYWECKAGLLVGFFSGTALRTIPADFQSGDNDVKAAIPLNLSL